MAKPFTPRDYQELAIQLLLENPHAAFFLKPGLGKTASVLATYLILKQEGMCDTLFITAPLRPCYYVWPYEVQDWADFNGFTVKVLHGKNKLKDLQAIEDKADIYVMNPEGLDMLTERKRLRGRTKDGKPKLAKRTFIVKPEARDILEAWGTIMWAGDESTMFKNHSSQRFYRMQALVPYFNRRVIMSGTPAPRGFINMWSQIYLLDEGASLGPNITYFRNKYFSQDPYDQHGYTLMPGADEQILNAIKPFTISLGYEWLDMPKGLPINIKVRLPDKARAFYDEFERESIAELEGHEFVATMAAAHNMRLRQIANGGLYDEEKKVHHVHDAKTEALIDLVDELNGRPVLVGYEFNHDLQRLRKAFPKAPAIGELSAAEQEKAFKRFNRGSIPVLLMQYQSGAHGLNLQHSNGAVCFYSIIYDLEVYEQFLHRVLRQGVEEDVPIYHLMAADTIDEVIAEVLMQKDITQDSIERRVKTTFIERAKECGVTVPAHKRARGAAVEREAIPVKARRQYKKEEPKKRGSVFRQFSKKGA